jgi:hypothetical protein
MTPSSSPLTTTPAALELLPDCQTADGLNGQPNPKISACLPATIERTVSSAAKWQRVLPVGCPVFTQLLQLAAGSVSAACWQQPLHGSAAAWAGLRAQAGSSAGQQQQQQQQQQETV